MEVRPEVFTTDFTGRPGERTFFLQSRSETLTLTYLLEKGQVEVLGEKLKELLLMIDPTDPIRAAVPQRDPAYALSAPIEPEWRVGTIGLTYEEASESIVIALEPAGAEAEEDEERDVEDFAVRVLLRRDQARAFVLHALAVVGEGRPLCQLCGLPMDPDGHKCPASNGHRLSS
ncbi:MAG TPA: DUF3090 family protein [Actinomycetota bacterium]|nr:DUF3090 family protein [Actinomycetota bacterium]